MRTRDLCHAEKSRRGARITRVGHCQRLELLACIPPLRAAWRSADPAAFWHKDRHEKVRDLRTASAPLTPKCKRGRGISKWARRDSNARPLAPEPPEASAGQRPPA